jgi:hypothetical protein
MGRRFQWPRRLRRGSATVRLLGLWVRIPRAAWMYLCCECGVLSDRGLCDELITRPEESYRLCVCLIVWDLETPTTRRPRPELGCCATGKERKKMGHPSIRSLKKNSWIGSKSWGREKRVGTWSWCYNGIFILKTTHRSSSLHIIWSYYFPNVKWLHGQFFTIK